MHYLRQVRGGPWKTTLGNRVPDSNPDNGAVQEAVDQFLSTEYISVYRVESLTDIAWISLGLSAERPHPNPIDFMLITQHDLEGLSFAEVDNPGETRLAEANDLHVDLRATPEGIETLVRRLVARGVPVSRIGKRALRESASERLKNKLPTPHWLLPDT